MSDEISDDFLAEVMGSENNTQQESPPIPAMPQLPDGTGLDYEQVAKLITEKCKVIVEQDDPILMLVPVLNSFLEQEEKISARHNNALIKIVSDKTDKYTSAVEKVSKDLGETLSSTTMSAMQETFITHKQEMDNHRNSLKWTTSIITLSALINVGVFIALFLIKNNG